MGPRPRLLPRSRAETNPATLASAHPEDSRHQPRSPQESLGHKLTKFLTRSQGDVTRIYRKAGAELDRAFKGVLNHAAANENAGGTTANFNSGTFGRITTQAGDPRIIQLRIKYAF